jgi:hypothetical protein
MAKFIAADLAGTCLRLGPLVAIARDGFEICPFYEKPGP